METKYSKIPGAYNVVTVDGANIVGRVWRSDNGWRYVVTGDVVVRGPFNTRKDATVAMLAFALMLKSARAAAAASAMYNVKPAAAARSAETSTCTKCDAGVGHNAGPLPESRVDGVALISTRVVCSNTLGAKVAPRISDNGDDVCGECDRVIPPTGAMTVGMPRRPPVLCGKCAAKYCSACGALSGHCFPGCRYRHPSKGGGALCMALLFALCGAFGATGCAGTMVAPGNAYAAALSATDRTMAPATTAINASRAADTAEERCNAAPYDCGDDICDCGNPESRADSRCADTCHAAIELDRAAEETAAHAGDCNRPATPDTADNGAHEPLVYVVAIKDAVATLRFADDTRNVPSWTLPVGTTAGTFIAAATGEHALQAMDVIATVPVTLAGCQHATLEPFTMRPWCVDGLYEIGNAAPGKARQDMLKSVRKARR